MTLPLTRFKAAAGGSWPYGRSPESALLQPAFPAWLLTVNWAEPDAACDSHGYRPVVATARRLPQLSGAVRCRLAKDQLMFHPHRDLPASCFALSGFR